MSVLCLRSCAASHRYREADTNPGTDCLESYVQQTDEASKSESQTLFRRAFIQIADAPLDDPERMFTPSLDDYLRPLAEELKPDSGVEEKYSLRHNKVRDGMDYWITYDCIFSMTDERGE